MSLGDDQEGSGGYGGTGQTRTRYPEGGSDVYGGARRGAARPPEAWSPWSASSSS